MKYLFLALMLFGLTAHGSGFLGVSGPIGQLSGDEITFTPGDTTSEKQFFYLAYAATSGTYKLRYSGQDTATLNWNDDAATVQAALEALSNIGSGNITVSGSLTDATPPSGWTFTYTGDLKGQDLVEMQTTSFALNWSGGAYPGWAVWFETIQTGGKGPTIFKLARDWSILPGDDDNSIRFMADDAAEPSLWEFVGKWNPAPAGAYHGLRVRYKGQRVSDIYLGYGPWDANQPGVITPATVWLMLGAGGGGRYQTTIYLDPINKYAYGSDGLVYTGWGGSETNPPQIGISRTSGRYQEAHFIDEVSVGGGVVLLPDGVKGIDVNQPSKPGDVVLQGINNLDGAGGDGGDVYLKPGTGAASGDYGRIKVDGRGFQRIIKAMSQVNLTADNTQLDVSDTSFIEISSDDAVAANRTFNFGGGTYVEGHEVTMCWTGANAGELLDVSNHKLSAAWIPGDHDCITQIYRSGDGWLETGRSDN